MKFYKQFLAALSLVSLSVPGVAVAQDATPAPKANTMTDIQKKSRRSTGSKKSG